MATNGHFASIGAESDQGAYEHGVQVIGEDKEFKYVVLSDALSYSSDVAYNSLPLGWFS